MKPITSSDWRLKTPTKIFEERKSRREGMEISKSLLRQSVNNMNVTHNNSSQPLPVDSFIASQKFASGKTVTKEKIKEIINGVKFTTEELGKLLFDKKEVNDEKPSNAKIEIQALAVTNELSRLIEKGLIDEETAIRILVSNTDDLHIDSIIKTDGNLDHGILPQTNGTFISGGGDGIAMKYLTSYDKTGKVLWRSKDLIDKTPAMDKDGNFYFAKNHNTASYDKKGNKRWEFHRDKKAKDYKEYGECNSGDCSGSSGIPAIDEEKNTLYFGEWYGKFIAVDKDTGDVKWIRCRPGMIEKSDPVIDRSGNIFFHDDSGYVLSVSPDGKENWITGVGYSKDYPSGSNKDGDNFSIGTSQILVGNDEKVVFGMRDGKIIALNHNNGSLESFFDAVDPIYSTPLDAKEGKIVFSTSNGHVFCVDTANPVTGEYGKEMKPLWDIEFDEYAIVKLVDNEGKIYVASPKQGLIVLNPDGTKSWSAGIIPINDMAMMPDGTVLATSKDNILCLKTLEERLDKIKDQIKPITVSSESQSSENAIIESETTVNIGGIIVNKKR
ncbi:MAG: PQQ-binding-like beta-propeller repeat protein [Candidatus Xenobiia bacterium LiM19]